MPTVLTAELAVELDCDLGEGPYWDDAQQELYFVDITNKQVKIFSPSDSSVKSIHHLRKNKHSFPFPEFSLPQRASIRSLKSSEYRAKV